MRLLILDQCGFVAMECKCMYAAWIGGALGIFVGYSFFNLSQHIIDIVFYIFPSFSCSKASKENGHSPELSNGDKYSKPIWTLRPRSSLF